MEKQKIIFILKKRDSNGSSAGQVLEVSIQKLLLETEVRVYD